MPTEAFFKLEEAKKLALLQSAVCEFSQLPYDKVSVFKIAKNAGISRSAFYYYFKDKEDIYQHIERLVFENMANQLRKTEKRHDPFALCREVFTYAAKLKETNQRALIRQLIVNMRPDDTVKMLRQMESYATQEYLALFKESLECFNISSERDFLEFSFLLASSVLYALRLYLIEEQSFSTAEERLNRMLMMIRHGILK